MSRRRSHSNVVPVAERRLTRSNFLPSGLRAVTSKMSSKRVTRAAEAAVAILFCFVLFNEVGGMDEFCNYLCVLLFMGGKFYSLLAPAN